MGFRSGWEQPNWFSLPGDERGYKPSFRRTNWFEPVGRECAAVTNHVGVIDLTSYGKFDVSGKDASSFLDMMFANRLPEVSIYYAPVIVVVVVIIVALVVIMSVEYRVLFWSLRS